jgi:hypothetical protein
MSIAFLVLATFINRFRSLAIISSWLDSNPIQSGRRTKQSAILVVTDICPEERLDSFPIGALCSGT